MNIAQKKYYKSNNENLNYKFKRNEYIRAREVRVLDEESNQLGLMDTSAALALAREQEMDLIEIVSNIDPPVCKIISWSKFKYEYSKKQKGQKQHSSQLKEMWFKPLTDVGDLNHKMKKVLSFIEDKNKVKLTVKSNRKTARLDKRHYFDLLTRILSDLQEVAEVETPPKLEGRNVYAIIKPKK